MRVWEKEIKSNSLFLDAWGLVLYSRKQPNKWQKRMKYTAGAGVRDAFRSSPSWSRSRRVVRRSPPSAALRRSASRATSRRSRSERRSRGRHRTLRWTCAGGRRRSCPPNAPEGTPSPANEIRMINAIALIKGKKLGDLERYSYTDWTLKSFQSLISWTFKMK